MENWQLGGRLQARPASAHPRGESSRHSTVCAVLFRLFGTVGLFNKLQTQKHDPRRIDQRVASWVEDRHDWITRHERSGHQSFS
eukprot:scaffold25505_cov71-Phaeocystis_antarctica.AAC.2